MDGILRSPPQLPDPTPRFKMNSCSYHRIGRCITPRNFLIVACQSRGGMCRSNLHPACQAQMEHGMNTNAAPAMILCPNCLRRVAGDRWNNDEAARILREAEGGVTAAGSAGIPEEAIMTHGAWSFDRTFNMYLSDSS